MTDLQTRKAAFVFQYMVDRSFGQDGAGNWRSTSIEATTSFDDGLDFVVAFGQAFPTPTPDPNHRLASDRLSRILKTLYEDGWLDRGRIGNESDGMSGMPKWQFVYSLTQRLVNDLKSGKMTPLEAAKQWGG